MARRWAISMRIRCSICARAASRKAKRARLLIRAFLEEAVTEIDGRRLCAPRSGTTSNAPCRAHGGAAMTAQVKPKSVAAFDAASARGFRHPVARGLWQAAGLSRQRRLGAEAAPGAGRDDATSPTSEYANVHRGVHYLSAAATERYEAARETVRQFLNAGAGRRDRLHQGRHRSDQSGRLSFLAPRIQPGDEIVLTVMEHHSNIVPWHFLRERQGAVLQMGRCAR